MLTWRHEPSRAERHVATSGLAIAGDERQLQHVIHTGYPVHQLQNLAAVDIAAEGPAQTIRTTIARIEERIERLVNLGPYSSSIGVGSRPNSGMHAHFEVLWSNHFDSRAYDARAIQIAPDGGQQSF